MMAKIDKSYRIIIRMFVNGLKKLLFNPRLHHITDSKNGT